MNGLILRLVCKMLVVATCLNKIMYIIKINVIHNCVDKSYVISSLGLYSMCQAVPSTYNIVQAGLLLCIIV